MGPKSKQTLTLVVTLVYLAFACLYVVVRYAGCGNLYRPAVVKVAKPASGAIAKNAAFQYRPRVVNNRPALMLISPGLLFCPLFSGGFVPGRFACAIKGRRFFYTYPAIIFLRQLRI